MSPSVTHPANEHKPVPGVPLNPLPAPKSEPKWLAIDKIAESPFNPRNDFDKEKLTELAASISARGLLEPLVVRPLKKVGQYELMAGHRRLRALKLNKAEGCQCSVIEADDSQAHATLIVENLQREDLGPMEEAEAFDALAKSDPKAWTPQTIGAAIGKTPRFVQQRLAIKRNLVPEARKDLIAGTLSFEKARVLAGAPARVQKELIDGYDFAEASVEDIRHRILEEMVPVGRNAFALDLYKGEIHEDGKKKYFVDTDQFSKLQRQAAEAKVIVLKSAGWPDAKLVDEQGLHDWKWADALHESVSWSNRAGNKATGKYKLPKEKVTAIVWIDRTAQLRHAEGVAPSSALPKVRDSSPGYGPKPEDAAERKYRHAYNEAVRGAVGSQIPLAMGLLLMRFIDGTTRATYDYTAAKAAHAAILPKAMLPYVNCSFQGAKQLKLWALVKKLKAAETSKMVAQYAALSLSWHAGQGRTPPPMTALMAVVSRAKLPTKEKAPAKKKAAPKAKAKKAASKKKHP